MNLTEAVETLQKINYPYVSVEKTKLIGDNCIMIDIADSGPENWPWGKFRNANNLRLLIQPNGDKFDLNVVFGRLVNIRAKNGVELAKIVKYLLTKLVL